MLGSLNSHFMHVYMDQIEFRKNTKDIEVDVSVHEKLYTFNSWSV